MQYIAIVIHLAAIINFAQAKSCVRKEPLLCHANKPISDLSASSSRTNGLDFSEQQSCIDNVAVAGEHAGGWSAATNDANQWIQVEFDKSTLVEGIVTQGRQDAEEWVESFTLQHSNDGRTWSDVITNGAPHVFQANRDQNNEVHSNLPYAVVTKHMRLKIVSYHNHISLRWQMIGCYEPSDLCSMSTPQVCNGNTRVASVTASSVYSHYVDHGVDNICLDKPEIQFEQSGAWSSKERDRNQWIKIELEEWSSVTAIITQGRNDMDQWVTSYTVKHSLDDKEWFPIANPDGSPIVYTGNNNRHDKVKNLMPTGLIAKFLRIHPVTWKTHISMRLEVIGCLLDELPMGFDFPITNEDVDDLKTEDATDEDTAKAEAKYEKIYGEIQDLRHNETNVERKKRGIATVLVIAITIGAEGYLLANALNGGCTSNPDICEHRDEIKRLKPLIDALKDKYDKDYTDSQVDYLAMREALYKNDYLLYYTNETVRAVKKIDQMYKDIVADLTVRLPILTRMASNSSMTSEEYLNAVLGPLTNVLDQVNEMIAAAKKGTMISVAINTGANALVGYFLSNYKIAVDQVGGLQHKPHQKLGQLVDAEVTARAAKTLGIDPDAIPTAAQYNTRWSKVKGAYHNFVYSVKRQFKVVARTFKLMATRPFKYISLKIRAAAGSVRSFFSSRPTFNNFKVSMVNKFNAGLTSMKNGLTRLRNTRFNQFSLKGFKFSWSVAASVGITAAMSAVAIAMDKKQWDTVEDEIKKARINTENYYQSLINQTALLAKDVEEMQVVWQEAAANFKIISEAFAEMITNATTNSAVVDATTIGFHFNLSNDIFNPDFFKDISKANLENKQQAAIDFLSSVDNDYEAAKNMLFGRVTFYNKIVEDYNVNKTVRQIYSVIVDILSYSAYQEAKAFGALLRKQDVLCFIALVYHFDHAQYDHYNLSRMLPLCDITDAEWTSIDLDANNNRFTSMMTFWVKVDVDATGVSISATLDSVKREFARQNDPAMTAFANSLTVKKILCVVAHLTSATTYDFYDMALYRDNDCDAITDAQFTQSQANAADLRAKVDGVDADMYFCERRPTRCECPKDMADFYDIDLDILKQLMKLARPNESSYTGSYPDCNPKTITF